MTVTDLVTRVTLFSQAELEIFLYLVSCVDRYVSRAHANPLRIWFHRLQATFDNEQRIMVIQDKRHPIQADSK